MKKLLNWFVSAAILFTASSLLAETSYTVDRAVEAALANNRSVMQTRIETTALKRKKDISLNGLSPSLSAGAGVAYPNEPSTYDHTAYWMANISFSFSASIAANVKQAKINYEAGLISQETILKDIELAVRKSFYGLLYEQINIDLQKRNLETAKSRYDQTMAQYKRGRVPELDVMTAKVNWENLKPTLASAETTWQNDLASFKQLIGIDQKEEIALEGSLDDVLDLKQITIENSAVASNDVRSAEKNLELAKATLTAARLNTYSPRVTLGYTYQPSKGYSPVNSTVPETGWSDAGEISAGITVPLDGVLPWSDANSDIASAKENIESLELQLKETITSSEVYIESLLRQIARSQSTIRAHRENIILAERSYAMMEIAYRHGTKDLLSLQDSADSLFQSRVALMAEAYTLISAVLELENEIGAPYGSMGR